MAKKKRVPNNNSNSDRSNAAPGQSGGLNAAASRQDVVEQTQTSKKSQPAITEAKAAALPAEVERGDWTVIILALMIFLAPAVGVPNEMMLQDTLKSIVVSFAAVGAGLLFFWHQRNRRDGLRWHAIMWLPLALMFYALGSMVWSHTYLGGVEAIRWFVFSLIVWLGINTFSRQRTPYLLEGIHWGAFVCSLWTRTQSSFYVRQSQLLC
jgi:O-antigen ligase